MSTGGREKESARVYSWRLDAASFSGCLSWGLYSTPLQLRLKWTARIQNVVKKSWVALQGIKASVMNKNNNKKKNESTAGEANEVSGREKERIYQTKQNVISLYLCFSLSLSLSLNNSFLFLCQSNLSSILLSLSILVSLPFFCFCLFWFFMISGPFFEIPQKFHSSSYNLSRENPVFS